MKNQLKRCVAVGISIAFACVFASAQDATLASAAGDKYVISAKAGGVNFVEGSVSVARKSGRSGYLLKGDRLEVGDRVLTGGDGKAEILLNPGSYLRLGGNSKFEFKTTSLDDLALKLDSGSAILEVYAADEFTVNLATPSTVYTLIKTGVYRIDVPVNGEARLRVWKGTARIGGVQEVKAGRAAVRTGGGNVSLAKFDRDTKDALDIWSKARSKELAKQSASLRRNDVRTALMQSFLGRRWNFMNSFGLWVFDPRFGGYFFLPFGSGWNSPYGYSCGSGMGWWWWNNFPTYMPPVNPGGSNTGGGTPTSPGATPIRTAGDRSPIPPFIRMEQMGGGGLNGGAPGRGGSTYDSGSNSPSYSPSYSPPPSSAPPSSSSTGARPDPTGTKP